MSTKVRSRARPPGATPGGDGPEQPFGLLSIGALSRATGVPVETLRTWERRYDFPKPAPREGDTDHRRYPLSAVERLRLVVRALDNQHAASVVLRASLETLHELVAVGDAPGAGRPPARGRAATGASPAKSTSAGAPSALPRALAGSFEEVCTKHVLALDGEALVAELERAWAEVGGLECLVGRVGPFLSALGTGWSVGEIEVGHEHFASEHVREFLSGHWRPMSERNAGPRVVCATLAGELHVLGLHMAATTLALSGARVVFLGADTPAEDVASTASAQHAAAVALSAAQGTSPRLLEHAVGALRRLVPAEISIVCGGRGFERAPKHTRLLSDLPELFAWAKALPANPPSPPPKGAEAVGPALGSPRVASKDGKARAGSRRRTAK